MCQELSCFQDWTILPGMDVEIRQWGVKVRIGRVDVAMEDGTALWLAGNGVYERKMIEKAEGFSAWGSASRCGLPKEATAG